MFAGFKAEWNGGRSLWGNRSILADPCRPDMKDILNAKIKRHESFRPFAPSILREAISDWFETNDDVPFMREVFQIRAPKRSFIPAVPHVDGRGDCKLCTRRKIRASPYWLSPISPCRLAPLLLRSSLW
jgi:carbamoyltransferase